MKQAVTTWVLFFALGCGSTGSDDGAGSGGVAKGGTAGTTGGTAGTTTGGSAGTASGGAAGNPSDGGNAATGGGGSSACDSLLDQYQTALQKAKQCPLVSSEETCTAPIDTSIGGCGYYDFGDESNADAIAELDTIQGQWFDQNCVRASSCALGGFPPMLATCKSNGEGGTLGTCAP